MKKILLVSANYPDSYNIWAPWNKYANLAISKVDEIGTEIIAPRPYVLPFKFLPYSNLYHIPIRENAIEGIIHYPRFLYLLPKKIFYGFIGDFYKLSVATYVLQNIEKSDLVHSHHIYPDGYGFIPVCKNWKIPLVVDIHGDTLLSNWLKNIMLRKKVLKVFDFASKIICISNNIYSLAVENGLDEKKLEYIPLGVDIDKFKPRNKEAIRKELNIIDQKIILFVGQLIERKGVNYLLSAVSKLDRSVIKGCKFVIVGSGPEHENLKQLTKKLNLQDFILFTGLVPEEELLKWFSLADIFVLPSLSEGRPMVINQAMASECAIVASNVSGIPEQIQNGYNGFLVEVKNIEMLSEKIDYLLRNETEMIKMGKNGRKKIIEDHLSWEGYAKRVNNIYQELL